MELESVIRIIEAIAILLGGGFVLFKIGKAVSKFEVISSQQSKEITELKDAMSRIGDIITQMAIQTQRQDAFAQRITQVEKRVDELAHGEGFIYPLGTYLAKPRP